MDKSTNEPTRCPVLGATAEIRPTTHRDWWPEQLDLSLLHQNSSKGNPLGGHFE